MCIQVNNPCFKWFCSYPKQQLSTHNLSLFYCYKHRKYTILFSRMAIGRKAVETGISDAGIQKSTQQLQCGRINRWVGYVRDVCFCRLPHLCLASACYRVYQPHSTYAGELFSYKPPSKIIWQTVLTSCNKDIFSIQNLNFN